LVGRVQQFINSPSSRSTKIALFKVANAINMKERVKLLEEDFLNELQEEMEKIRVEAKENIAKIQEENRKSINKSRKPESE